ARAMLAARETDGAVAAAWDDRMGVVQEACRDIVERLEREGMLARGWTLDEAAEMLWSLLSIGNWENLTLERGWTVDRYVENMKEVVRSVFVRNSY
ncbi:MAG TPA: hypothetical protein VFY59_02785, partial [Rubrobacter sp.]|nr:hypothetical protein [Rubrobacter sp.]